MADKAGTDIIRAKYESRESLFLIRDGDHTDVAEDLGPGSVTDITITNTIYDAHFCAGLDIEGIGGFDINAQRSVIVMDIMKTAEKIHQESGERRVYGFGARTHVCIDADVGELHSNITGVVAHVEANSSNASVSSTAIGMPRYKLPSLDVDKLDVMGYHRLRVYCDALRDEVDQVKDEDVRMVNVGRYINRPNRDIDRILLQASYRSLAARCIVEKKTKKEAIEYILHGKTELREQDYFKSVCEELYDGLGIENGKTADNQKIAEVKKFTDHILTRRLSESDG